MAKSFCYSNQAFGLYWEEYLSTGYETHKTLHTSDVEEENAEEQP